MPMYEPGSHMAAWQEHQMTHAPGVTDAVVLEYIAPGLQDSNGWGYAPAHQTASREEWAKYMVERGDKPAPAMKPPKWWLAEQDKKGRQSAKFNIWHNRYSLARKISIWLMAPDDDFYDAGYAIHTIAKGT